MKKRIYDNYEIDEYGNVYISIIEASRKTNVSRSAIHYHLKKGTGGLDYA